MAKKMGLGNTFGIKIDILKEDGKMIKRMGMGLIIIKIKSLKEIGLMEKLLVLMEYLKRIKLLLMKILVKVEMKPHLRR